MKRFVKAALCAAFFFLCAGPRDLYGQRTAFRSSFGSFSAVYSVSSLGLEADYGQYLQKGYWAAGLSAVNRGVIEETTGEPVSFSRLEAFGKLMWSPWRMRDRSVNVYVGGDAFIGWEFLDPFRSLDRPLRKAITSAGYSSTAFVYGASPRAEVEWFPFRSTAFTAGIRIPVAFGSNIRELGFEAALGVRQNF